MGELKNSIVDGTGSDSAIKVPKTIGVHSQVLSKHVIDFKLIALS
jgi:hypothetical protein